MNEENKDNGDDFYQTLPSLPKDITSEEVAEKTQSSSQDIKSPKNLLAKIIIGVVCFIVIAIIIGVANIYKSDADGKNKYDEAVARCGHNPIVNEHGPSFEPYQKLTLNPISPAPNDEMYCTISEAIADGQNETVVKDAIPSELLSEYR